MRGHAYSNVQGVQGTSHINSPFRYSTNEGYPILSANVNDEVFSERAPLLKLPVEAVEPSLLSLTRCLLIVSLQTSLSQA